MSTGCLCMFLLYFNLLLKVAQVVFSRITEIQVSVPQPRMFFQLAMCLSSATKFTAVWAWTCRLGLSR